jgi:Uma2 family endonuclease
MGVPEYWIVNVASAEIEVHLDPKDGRYRSVRTLGKGESITLAAFADVTIAVADVVR